MGTRRKKKVRGNRRRREPLLARARRRVFRAAKLAAAVAVVPALAYAAWLLYGFTTTTTYLAVQDVEIIGAERVTGPEVMRYAAMALEAAGDAEDGARPGGLAGRNLFSFSTRAVEEALEANPWVAGARVKRRPPGGLRIEITERSPLALVRMDGLYVMDTSGVVFKDYDEADGLDLPVITGLHENGDGPPLPEDRLLALLAILKAREGFGLDHVSEIHIDPVYGLTLYTLEGGVRLDVGTSRFASKLDVFEKVLRARKGRLSGVVAMDLNRPGEVIVTFDKNVVREGGVI
ncbi:MAG: cell division protein FtsQ/DivIB [Thermodesulfobacteriota bacterium]